MLDCLIISLMEPTELHPQTRISNYFDTSKQDSIPSQLINSDFNSWPDTMRVEKVDNCYEWARPCPDGCCQVDCYEEATCDLYDGYRHDMKADSINFGCDTEPGNPCGTQAECVPIDDSECSAMKEAGEKHAQDTIDAMLADVDAVEQGPDAMENLFGLKNLKVLA